MTFAKLAGSEKLLYSLFCNVLFADYWASFSLLAFFLQMVLRTLSVVLNAGSPTMDHGLFIGGCLRYRSIAARIVQRDETLNLFRLSASLRH